MDYTLAKELKDAGFPQRNTGICKHDLFGFSKYRESCDCSEYDVATVPDIEELIDACGDDFGELYRFPNGWLVESYDDESYFSGEGKTPLEAVAKLWLALNSKK